MLRIQVFWSMMFSRWLSDFRNIEEGTFLRNVGSIPRVTTSSETLLCESQISLQNRPSNQEIKMQKLKFKEYRMVDSRDF
jgi:hypothetical protein